MNNGNNVVQEVKRTWLKDKVDQFKWWWHGILRKKWVIGPIIYEENNFVKHAKREFIAIGYKPVDEEDGPNKWIQEGTFELLDVFGDQGHSGSSAPFAIRFFTKLAGFKPLSPIKCDDAEWNYVGHGDDTYQNNRLSSVFKTGKDGDPYYIDAIVWNETGEHSGAFTGTVDGIRSSQLINLPFTPKTFYIDVVSTRWADKEEKVKDLNGDWWTHKIKDPKQLKEVWEYYKKKAA